LEGCRSEGGDPVEGKIIDMGSWLYRSVDRGAKVCRGVMDGRISAGVGGTQEDHAWTLSNEGETDTLGP